ncbi:MAG: hypothetical protein V3S98_00090 [Dehalococcoidia bacterium]
MESVTRSSVLKATGADQTSVLSHDLSNRLAGITGLVQLVLERDDLTDPRSQRELRMVLEEAEQSVVLVRELRAHIKSLQG